MKKILLLALFLSFGAHALPILNESVATNSIYTIYPDSENQNLYYISPNFMSVALDEDGIPLFNYTEYKVGFRRYQANIQMVMRVQNYQEELRVAKETVLSNNPNAKFALTPFASSQIEFDDKFKSAITDHSCNHMGGEYSAEQSCILVLSNLGRNIFKNNIRKRLTLVMNFKYRILGVNRMADDTFSNTERIFKIAARVGGDVLLDYPDLFTDWRGRIIRL